MYGVCITEERFSRAPLMDTDFSVRGWIPDLELMMFLVSGNCDI